VFNDINQNVFSERQVTAWGWTWGQFLDHTFGLRLGAEPGEPTGETTNIPFNSADPMEEFANNTGNIPFVRSAPAPGTGVTNPRQQINTLTAWLDGSVIYGYGVAQTMVKVLEMCGDDLTRANVMKQAASLKDFAPDTLLPGVKITTSATDFAPIEQLQMQRFKGEKWELFGDIISGELSN